MNEVVGRDAELSTIEDWLKAPSGQALLIEGDAGIGKTTLWRNAIADAESHGYRVLAATAAGAETQLAFTTLRDLVAGTFDEIAGQLPPPQRRALGVVLLQEEPGPSPPDPGVISVALASTIAALGASGPTLLAIDDVQWMDPASAEPLSYVLRRLDASVVAVLLARRLGVRARLLDSLPAERLNIVTLGPLSVGALGRILHERLGASYTRPTLHRLHTASGGNPFFALQIGEALEELPDSPDPSAPLPIPTDLDELLLQRIQALSPQAREALLGAAATAMPTTDVIEGICGTAGLEEAIDSGFVVARGTRLRFTHPLLAAAVYAHASPRRRRSIHQRLATVVADPQEQALHLALAADGPDTGVARALDSAAGLARSRGAPEQAARLSQEAARITPSDDRDGAARRTIAAALWWTDAGDTQRALALIEPLLDELPRGTRRLDALYAKARAVEDHVYGELLESAVAEAEGHPTQQVRLLLLLCYALLHGLEFDAARTRADAAVRVAEQTADASSIVLALSMAGRLSTAGGGLDALHRARELEPDATDVDAYESPATWLGWWLLANDELDAARRLLVDQQRKAIEDGDGWNQTFLHWPLTELECRSGNFAAARALAKLGLELAEQSNNRYAVSALQYCSALVAAHVGESADAADHAERSLANATALRSVLFTVRPRIALGLLAVSEERYTDAITHLADLPELALTGPYWAAYPFWGDLVEAFVAVGELEGAHSLLADLDEHGLAAQRPGTVPVLTRCRGIVHMASGSPEEGIASFEEALRLERARSVPLERGRTLLALGEAQRRVKLRRASRETLHEALTTFESVGARLWAARATSQLARIGGRPASSDELTPAEQRVAELVAEGNSNKEVAAVLVVSVHTVESALTSIYRKLDVHSRTEMARKLAESKD